MSSPASSTLFVRSRDDRLIAGVAGGIGERLGVDPVLVRAAFVILSISGPTGIVLYLMGYWLSAEPHGADAGTVRPPDRQRAVALALVVLGALLLARNLGLWFGDEFVWPIALAAVGSAIIWARSDEDDRERWSRLTSRLPGDPIRAVFTGRVSPVRVAVGGVLLAAGLGAFLAANQGLASVRPILLGMLVTSAGIALIFGPWLLRLGQQLAAERRERIRSEERAEVAAHLHDSVLQTFALVQRRSDVPKDIVILARRQERELRDWLYGDPVGNDDTLTVRQAVNVIADEVEAQHDVQVETVVVGDRTIDDRLRQVLHALREATLNAARHSKADNVSVFLEVEPQVVTAFVHDRGVGFDPAAIATDRGGIRESIRGRIERMGGTVTIVSEPGEGTEVSLRVPGDWS